MNKQGEETKIGQKDVVKNSLVTWKQTQSYMYLSIYKYIYDIYHE